MSGDAVVITRLWEVSCTVNTGKLIFKIQDISLCPKMGA